MSFAQLQKACLNCKESSVKTYWANIKSLSRLAGHADLPAGASWLNDKLLKRVLTEPTNRAKRFTTAGVKAAQMYKVKRPKWGLAMSESTEKYARIRESGKRTKREHENWPQGGYKALGTLAKTLHSEQEHLEQKKLWNRSDLYHYQRFLIVLFYSKHALRGDLAVADLLPEESSPTRPRADDTEQSEASDGEAPPARTDPLAGLLRGREALDVAAYLLSDQPLIPALVGRRGCGKTSLAAEIAAMAPDLTVHVIGFKVSGDHFDWSNPNDQAATTVARCLADRTGGRYVRAETVDELIGALRVTLGCNVLGALPVQGRRLQ